VDSQGPENYTKTMKSPNLPFLNRLPALIEGSLWGLIQRDEPIRLGILAALAGESVFLLGPPGVGKSLVARRMKCILRGGRSFEYLMGKFSTPDELFGPVSIQKLTNEDEYVRLIEGYLPDSEVVFLDEVWNASPPIQNALLTAMNEKRYRNGRSEILIPMTLLLGASNSLHPGEETAAFWDRFLIRLVVSPILGSGDFSRFLAEEGDPYRDPISPDLKIDPQELRDFRSHLSEVNLGQEIILLLTQLRESLESQGPSSDRRWKKIVHLLKASALAHGRSEVSLLDCFLLSRCLWNDPDDRDGLEKKVRSLIQDRLHEIHEIPRHTLARARNFLTDLDSRLSVLSGETYELPKIIDKEYYEILLPSSPKMYRLWCPDGDEYLAGVDRPLEAFLYNDGRLEGTRTITLTRAEGSSNPYELLLVSEEGEKSHGYFRTEKRTRSISTAEDRKAALKVLPEIERDTLALDSRTLCKECREVLSDLSALDADLRHQAKTHLFVSREQIADLDSNAESLGLELHELAKVLEELIPSDQ